MRARIATLVLIVALAALGFPGAARAHANLVGSDPAANAVIGAMPPELVLWFTETPELRFSEVQVVGPDGQRVDNGDLHVHGADPRVRGIDARPGDPRVLGITVKPNLPGGTYTVIWKVLSSVDGHVTRGLYAFSVGAPSPPSVAAAGGALDTGGGGPPKWLAVLSRWVTFVGLFLTLGFVTFPLLIGAPALRAAGAEPASSKNGALLAFAAGAALVVGAALALVLQAWAAAGALPDAFGATMRQVLTESRFGNVWTVRAVLTALAIEGFLLARPWRVLEHLRPRNLVSWLPLTAAAVGLPLTVSMNSHAAAGDSERLGTALDWIHLLAGGAWAGGLALFVWFLADVRKVDVERRARVLAVAVPRFSALAMAAVATLAGTGAYQWWRQLGDLGDTTGSGYGRLFLVKMAVVAPLLALGAFNLLVVRPRLGAGIRGRMETALRAARSLARSVPVEAGLAVAVLAVTAALTDTSPPSAAAPPAPPVEGILQTQTVDDLTLTVSVDPGHPGQNRMDFYLQDNDGDERPVQRFIVRLTYLDQRLGTTEDDAKEVHPTHFVLEGSQLALPGRWRVDLVVRRQGLEDARASFELQVNAP